MNAKTQRKISRHPEVLETTLNRKKHASNVQDAGKLLAEILEELRAIRNLGERVSHPNKPMNRREAAKYLGVDPSTLYKWAKSGKIPYYSIGDGDRGAMRFRQKDLDRFLEGWRVPAEGEIDPEV